jgi:hypothetical protein
MAMWKVGALISCLLFVYAVPSPPDVRSIIQRSVGANRADWKASPGYDYFERDQQPDGGTKTFEEIMLLGSRYERLVSVDGKALSAGQQTQEQQTLDEATRERSNESLEQRAARVHNYEKTRKRDQLLLTQLTKAFDFRLVGKEKMDQHDVYVLDATPHPGYVPPNDEAKVLTGMKGKLWIDTASFQWVRVEAQVVHPVSIEGFLARVEPGTSFELEKMPVTSDIWLRSHFDMRAKARVLFFFTHRSKEDDTYYGYHVALDHQNRQSTENP